MRRREDLVGYDFQGWPVFKLNLKEILLQLGGKIENNKIVFDINNPYLEIYPSDFEDDGMAYGVNERCIIEAGCFEDESHNKYINIFREYIPDEKQQEKLFKRWDEGKRRIEEFKKSLENDN